MGPQDVLGWRDGLSSPLCEFCSQLQLDSDLSDYLNQELDRDTRLCAFPGGLEMRWMSQAQKGGPRNGDCHLPPQRHCCRSPCFLTDTNTRQNTTEARPGASAPQVPMQPIPGLEALAAV